jgi:lysozyme
MDMKPSQKCIDLIKKYEGYRSEAYICPAGVPTIGYGATMWPDGKKVQIGQKITMQQAEQLLIWEANQKAKAILPVNVNQNQADALISFAYNLGVGALNRSTLMRKVRLNPNDPTIRDEFMKWVNAGGKVLKGLVRRRKEEADLYYLPI